MAHPFQARTASVPAVNNDDIIHVDYFDEKTPVVSSRDVARHFGKQHKNILRQIQEIKSVIDEDFFRLNFEPIEESVPVGFGMRNSPAYLLTRDAFTLLVMGFTGAAAMRWKLKYIEAFNALERAAAENALEMARQAGYRQGIDEVRPALAGAAFENGVQAVLGLTRGQREILKDAVRLNAAGLTNREVARVIGCCLSNVQRALKAVRP